MGAGGLHGTQSHDLACSYPGAPCRRNMGPKTKPSGVSTLTFQENQQETAQAVK